jgi:hypothetical protein
MMENEEKLIEELADVVHEQWSHWMKYMLSKAKAIDVQFSFGNNGCAVLFEHEDYVRWIRQKETLYKDLSEKEKNSDKEWAKKYLSIFKNSLRNAT